MKLLIHTGSNISMLDPKIVEKYYPHNEFNEEFEIKTAQSILTLNKYAVILYFNELKYLGNLKIIMHKIHNFYNGVILLNGLKTMKFNLKDNL